MRILRWNIYSTEVKNVVVGAHLCVRPSKKDSRRAGFSLRRSSAEGGDEVSVR